MSWHLHHIISALLAIWKQSYKLFWPIVTLVVHKVCDVLKVVTLVGGVTFDPPELQHLWCWDACPPYIATFVDATVLSNTSHGCLFSSSTWTFKPIYMYRIVAQGHINQISHNLMQDCANKGSYGDLYGLSLSQCKSGLKQTPEKVRAFSTHSAVTLSHWGGILGQSLLWCF